MFRRASCSFATKKVVIPAGVPILKFTAPNPEEVPQAALDAVFFPVNFAKKAPKKVTAKKATKKVVGPAPVPMVLPEVTAIVEFSHIPSPYEQVYEAPEAPVEFDTVVSQEVEEAVPSFTVEDFSHENFSAENDGTTAAPEVAAAPVEEAFNTFSAPINTAEPVSTAVDASEGEAIMADAVSSTAVEENTATMEAASEATEEKTASTFYPLY